MPHNDEQPDLDVVDEGFRPRNGDLHGATSDDGGVLVLSDPDDDGTTPDGTAPDGTDRDPDASATSDGADSDAVTSGFGQEHAINSFLHGEPAMEALRERPWTRFASMSAYAVRDAFKGLRRRPALAASATLTVALCALLAGGAAIARAGVDSTMSRWADGVEFVVYVQPGASPADIARVGKELSAADGVRAVTPVSQQQAYKEYQRLYADESAMTEAVTPDLLPASFRVSPDDADPALIQRITRPLASDPDVYQVVTADQAVQDVRDLSGAVSGFGTWLAIVLGVVGVVLSASMIRSSIAARHREIAMMRAFGAGRTYIAAPVAIEGVLIGIASAVVAAGGLAFAVAQASSSDSSVVTSLMPPASEARSVIVVVVFATIAVCTVVSVLATANALRKSR